MDLQQNKWCPYCGERKRIVSILAHPIFEWLSIKYLISKGCHVEHEFILDADNKNQVDLAIKRDECFKKNIEKFQNIIRFVDLIQLITIDFTLSIDPDYIKSLMIDK